MRNEKGQFVKGNNFRLGIKHTEKSKKKISLSHIGMKKPWAISPIKRGSKRPPFSTEWLKNLSKSHLGFKPKPESVEKTRLKLIGHKGYWKGKKMSIDLRKKLSNIRILNREKSNFWKGGITKINLIIRRGLEYKLWREAVFKRDNWTCRECKKEKEVSGKLEAHHIKPFSLFIELRFDINNGVTLCKECHKKTDTYLWKIQKTYPQSKPLHILTHLL